MKNLCYFVLLLLALWACDAKNEAVSATAATGEAMNLTGYEMEEVPGTNWQKATKRDTDGNLMETGFVEAGQKVGTWVSYGHNKKVFPSQIATYKNGKLNGLFMQMNEGGLVSLMAYYADNQLNGHWGKYQFGRTIEEADYINGKLDGVYKVYTITTGALQTTAEYKNGVQDGYYRTYNPEGQITTEYLYKNGQKVSGGTVAPNSSPAN